MEIFAELFEVAGVVLIVAFIIGVVAVATHRPE